MDTLQHGAIIAAIVVAGIIIVVLGISFYVKCWKLKNSHVVIQESVRVPAIIALLPFGTRMQDIDEHVACVHVSR